MGEPLSWPIRTVTDTAVLVQEVTTVVLAANRSRADVVFVNDSNQPIYLARGNAAVMNAGIRLNASGLTFFTALGAETNKIGLGIVTTSDGIIVVGGVITSSVSEITPVSTKVVKLGTFTVIVLSPLLIP